jgi:hypothetical protein
MSVVDLDELPVGDSSSARTKWVEPLLCKIRETSGQNIFAPLDVTILHYITEADRFAVMLRLDAVLYGSLTGR